MAAVTTQGVNYFVSDLGKQAVHDSDARRCRWGCWLIEQLFRGNTTEDFKQYIPVMLKYLLTRVAELDLAVLRSVADALAALTAVAGSSTGCVTMDDLVGACW